MSSNLATIPAHRTAALERQLLAFLGGVVLQLILLVLGVALSALARHPALRPAFPTNMLQLLTVSLILAHCSLAAIWWARSDWPPHAKTMAAVLVCAGLWLLLVQVLETTRDSGQATLAWAVCIALQVIPTGIAVTVLELTLSFRNAAARTRFSLQYLLVWTTLLAIALGGTSAMADRFGFKLADVPNWVFFTQLQVVALAGAGLAAAIYGSARFPKTWPVRSLASATVALMGTTFAPLCLLAVFGDKAGVLPADLFWLYAAQSLFLLAVLLPLNVANEQNNSQPHLT